VPAPIGRRAELTAIEALLERAARGPAGLTIEGEAGIGKTTLWESARTTAAQRGFRVLSARPAFADAQVPLGGIGDLFSTVSSAALEPLPPPQRNAVEVALLRAEPRGRPPDQRALSVATVSLVRQLAAVSEPLLVAVDDVQWLDESSAAILSFAARRLEGSPVGFVLTVRGSGAEPDRLGLDTALGPDAYERLLLGPLSLAALHRVLGERLGHSFPRLILSRIEQASGGNPFYALEIARALDRSAEPPAPDRPLPVPATLAALTESRLAALPARTRQALLLTAATAEPTLEILAHAGISDPRKVLAPAVRDGLVTVRRAVVRFSHPLLAQAALASVDDNTLRRIHLQLAESAASEDDRARHLGEAAEGSDGTAAEALERAALRARERGASLDAVSLYERAGELTPETEPEAAARRAVLAAEGAFLDVSDLRYADAILARSLPSAEGTSLRALVWYYQGRQADATALCERALEETGEDGVLRAKVLLRCAYLHGQTDMERSEAELEEAVHALERAEGPLDPELVAAALLDRANAALQMATVLRRADVARAEGLHASSGRSWEWTRADAIQYELARHMDDLEVALAKLLDQIERRAERGGEDPFWFVHVALINSWLGQLRPARTWADRAVEAYSREGGDLYPAFALRGLALVEALEGHVDEARDLATRGLELATSRGDVVVSVLHRQILAFVALSTGEVAEADRHLTEAARGAEEVGARHPLRFRLDGDRVEAALALGDLDRCGPIVERLEHVARVAPTPWTLAVGARCRGLLEAARGDLDAAAAALERAVSEHERLPMPFERGRTLLVQGQVRHRRKEKRLADTSLRDALRTFEEIGTPLWAGRARTELERVAFRRRAPGELNETERQIAELAADGLTNHEIAQRAFVSVKTVEANLTRVYRKLGIRSRSSLGRALGSRPAQS
jgi:DNA-binding CsgD family transcriptional regulator/tetratricopeptide (TPR) repeat protein